MQTSPQIHAELIKCEALIEEMLQATSAQVLENRWQEFLGCLERVWNKCHNHFGKSPKWNGWKGRFEKQRRTDPLLSYLSNARGAHEHTVAEITEKTPGAIGVSPNGTVAIKDLKIGPDGIEGMWYGKLVVKFIPEKVELIPVTNRSRVYPVPDTHLGLRLVDKSVLTIARCGLAYYQILVVDAEKFFVK